LARNTQYGKRLEDEDIALYFELSRHFDIDYLAKKSRDYVLSGKPFPTPFDWGKHLGVLKKHGDDLEENAAWLILMELRQAAQSGDDANLTDAARSVLKAHGVSFWDYRYQDKARDKITVQAILHAFRAMSALHSQVDAKPCCEDPDLAHQGDVEKWVHPKSGKTLPIYQQGFIPGEKNNGASRTNDSKNDPWYDHSRPFSERMRLMMDDVDRQLERGSYSEDPTERKLAKKRKDKLLSMFGEK
jgi:hypothetical protein